MKRTIYIVEDEPNTCELYQLWLEDMGMEAEIFDSAEPALRKLGRNEPDAICLDIGLPGIDGLDALDRIANTRPHLPVMVMTSLNDARAGVRALRRGAADYLVKPINPTEFRGAVERAVRMHDLEREVRGLRTSLAGEARLHGMIGRSESMNRVAAKIGAVARTNVPVLVEGETGTGKELVARVIHDYGPRANGPFVAVNCGAIPRTLQESYFFGHEKGAFTGAEQRRRGFFEQADGGTLFLDEVGELTPEAQTALLRVLQEGKVRRVGGGEDQPVDVRVISATNRDLRAMVRSSAFREDLFFRLVVYPIGLPPLRERFGDVPLLIGHFLRQYAAAMGVDVPDVTEAAMIHLGSHAWPGNVRELQNTVQYALIASAGEPIEMDHLPETMTGARRDDRLPADVIALRDPASGEFKSFDDLEYEIFSKVRMLLSGNTTVAAQSLGVSRATYYRKIGQDTSGD